VTGGERHLVLPACEEPLLAPMMRSRLIPRTVAPKDCTQYNKLTELIAGLRRARYLRSGKPPDWVRGYAAGSAISAGSVVSSSSSGTSE
jgi:hypothetical protein